MPCASREFGRVRGGSRRRRFNTILKAANLKNRSALPPSRAAAIAREETNEKTAVRDAVGCTLDHGQEAKREILADWVFLYFVHPNRRTVHDRIAETIVVRDRNK